MRWFFILLSSLLCAQEIPNLEEKPQDFILETKRIVLPEYPDAFNPSIVRWNGYNLLNFRVIPNPKTPFTSYLGLVLLDDNFEPISDPQILDCRGASPIPSRAEDGRLLYIGQSLYLIYSDNIDEKISAGGYRMYIGEVIYENGFFTLANTMPIYQFEMENPAIKEKNWVPFDYRGHLLLAYSLNPHLIYHPVPGTTECESFVKTTTPNHWIWGPLRGGTTALPLPNGDYLAFFHSWKKMETVHSAGKEMPHYFMGAYTFSADPPFQIKSLSPEPIIAKGFYSGAIYKPYWGSLRCIFPSGFLFDDRYIWVVYGRQDRELWVMKLDKQGLLDSLVPAN